ncbi:hypothetical protein [Candidatus Nitrotoga sp. HW29]|nr:hypothetical protein [Candidatus Nitrotoga sp. HW29]
MTAYTLDEPAGVINMRPISHFGKNDLKTNSTKLGAIRAAFKVDEV